MKLRSAAVAVLTVGILVTGGIAGWRRLTSNPDALWTIVSDQCVPEARAGAATNTCAKVDLDGGYAVLKDRNGIGQYLLIPTLRIAGIESPELLKAGTPNYWRDAWEARHYVEQAVHARLERDDIGLAINSSSGRSQNQLHIHVDCMRVDVRAALTAQQAKFSEQWTLLATRLSGHAYRARLITDAALRDTDPFRLLFDAIQRDGESMADQTLLLTGTTLPDGKPAFILLSDHVKWGDTASAEELLDHSCGVRKQRAVLADR